MAIVLERRQSRRTDPLLLVYSFQFRSAFRATATPSQPQLRRPLPSLADTCGVNNSIDDYRLATTDAAVSVMTAVRPSRW